MLEKLKEKVYKANMQLPQLGLVTFTWGNVSGIDRESSLFVIKPSGVDYQQLKPQDMVVINLQGKIIEGDLKPSSDTPTHVVLYRKFKEIGGIVHTHSPWAVSFAAANMDIPAMNTTHADTFYNAIPVSDSLSQNEIASDYEKYTGVSIVRTFKERNLDYKATPGALVSHHGPFCWGKTPEKAVYNAKVLEIVAEEDYHTMHLTRRNCELPHYLLNKHYYRKHGKAAYYGQDNNLSS